MIREDRELLAELARSNGDMASLALRIMDGSAGPGEQQHYAQRLIAAGERLRRRADEMSHTILDGEVLAGEVLAGEVLAGEVLADKAIVLPLHTVEPD